MPESLTTLTGAFSDLIADLSPLVIGFLLLSGYLHSRGKESGFNLENKIRKENKLPVLQLKTEVAESVVPWKDAKLLRGGFTALGMMLMLSVYVLLMLLYTALSQSSLPAGDQLYIQITALMIYPVVMTAFAVFGGLINKAKRYGYKAYLPVFIFSAIPALACFFIPWIDISASFALIVQSFLLLLTTLCFSFTIGTQDGYNEAQIEKRYPFVTANLENGELLKGVRLISAKNERFYFLNKEGQELLIPASKLVKVTHQILPE